MINHYQLAIASLLFFWFPGGHLGAQEHQHHHGQMQVSKPEAPKIFLDKSPRVVAYQLKRLDNQRLLMVERNDGDQKYTPVYEAILIRSGMTNQFRQEAVTALSKILNTKPISVLIGGIEKLDTTKADERKTAEQLIKMLISQTATQREGSETEFETAKNSAKEFVRIAGFAALISSGKGEECFAETEKSSESVISMLNAFRYDIDMDLKDELLEEIAAIVANAKEQTVQDAAIEAMAFIEKAPSQRCEIIAPFIKIPKQRDQAVRSLLTIPVTKRPLKLSREIAEHLVQYAEDTPAKDRTSDAFIDAMQLADQSIGVLQKEIAKAYRTRLDAVTVRMIRIRTIEEEMRYDVPYFVVQAGKPIQIVLENHDLMPHNLVVSKPGTLKAVAQAGLNAGPKGGSSGLAYVPDMEEVIIATDLVPSDTQTRLTFDAPMEPGEYPYVCTFPQHWYRMYGVMVVVEDLDAWLENPTEPANPIGNNRSFVRAWSVEELEKDLVTGLKGRTTSIGKRLFEEASCLGCHRLGKEGGVIGPDLTKVLEKWKGNQSEILREILEPSHRVDEAYQMQKVLTVDGQTLTGIRVMEDDEKVLLMTNPESNKPVTLLQDDIEIMAPSAVSMMPKALLDQYTKDEIFEILAFLQESQQP